MTVEVIFADGDDRVDDQTILPGICRLLAVLDEIIAHTREFGVTCEPRLIPCFTADVVTGCHSQQTATRDSWKHPN